MSGGIDSALVATLAADALGPGSRARARDAARRTPRPRASRTRSDAPSGSAVRIDTVPITDVFDAYRRTLADLFAGTEEGVAEENLQARIRGNLLMALSNKFGSMVLATGNKSEYAVGYATLYGDMAGGFAPIKDVPKTLVYELARWRNAAGPAAAADPRPDHDQAAVRGAPAGPARHRLAAPVRGAGPDHRGLRRGRPRRGRHRRPGVRPGDGRARDRG